ncbi:MAG TPA: LysR family transcriptional regulator [Sphingobium sp.]
MDLTRADPARLRHFIGVMDTGSFARAAEASGISQPAISKSIQALEQALGMRLFERGRAGARPTAYADRLAAHARIILAEYSLAEAELRALSMANEQQIAIGASLSLAQSLLPRGIARFRRRWPDVTVSVEVGFSAPLYAALLNGDLDLVLSAPEEGVAVDERLSRTFLLEERDALVVGAGHPLLGRDVVSLADLVPFPWIVPRRSSRLDRIHAVFASHRLPPPAYVLRSESSDLARGLLAEEPFICLIGEDIFRSEIAAGRFATLPDPGLTTSRAAFLSTRRNSHLRPAARNLATLLKEVAGGA